MGTNQQTHEIHAHPCAIGTTCSRVGGACPADQPLRAYPGVLQHTHPTSVGRTSFHDVSFQYRVARPCKDAIACLLTGAMCFLLCTVQECCAAPPPGDGHPVCRHWLGRLAGLAVEAHPHHWRRHQGPQGTAAQACSRWRGTSSTSSTHSADLRPGEGACAELSGSSRSPGHPVQIGSIWTAVYLPGCGLCCCCLGCMMCSDGWCGG